MGNALAVFGISAGIVLTALGLLIQDRPFWWAALCVGVSLLALSGGWVIYRAFNPESRKDERSDIFVRMRDGNVIGRIGDSHEGD